MALIYRRFKQFKPFSAIRNIVEGFLITIVFLGPLTLFDVEVPREEQDYYERVGERILMYNLTIEQYYEKRKHWVTSNLGTILFKNQPIKYKPQNRTFTVLVYKHWHWFKHRHMTKKSFATCSVNNCKFIGEDKLINSVDAVVVHMQQKKFPWVDKRNTTQRWVFLTEESPIHTFIHPDPNISDISNTYNWSMTYRSDSDVPIPYGRVVPIPEELMHEMAYDPITKHIPYWEQKQRKVLVAALISHCNVPHRMNYIRELEKYIKVDIYGGCARNLKMKNSCPGHTAADCPKLNKYLFYLAFENSKCRQYLTEKVYHNAYDKGAIPIVMGPPVADCVKLLPPNSFLHVSAYDSPRELAMEILYLSINDEYFELFHKWRFYFSVINEHGFLGTTSLQLCRVCEALNYNDNGTKVYDEESMKIYVDRNILCKIGQPYTCH
ncbi:alpha-(1,3)-fucosyltransferase 7-like isoform X1 [Ostrinia furnacalis]|uniref:alpha-(1,3)-fucosyltransferase 7-like isoform X1 n=1 Tax=Ostrinia furnacalis TaxID=93504 RepID=UPI0010395EA5|nr:alpha-(1,3)-fucosyltransferase 7-like isoform X1 [Ostrinia furnacalis]